MKKEQNELEQQLWNDRCAIVKKHEEKVKVATTTASLVGVGLTKHEALSLNNAFKAELLKFDRDRVLPAWDGLVSSQQSMLALCDVPTMFMTSSVPDRERQQRVIQVLENIVGEGSGLT